jgi:hypothetical protein
MNKQTIDKEKILDLVEDLSAEDLFNFIKQELVTLKELQDTEFLDNSKRKAIIKLQKAEDDKTQIIKVEQDQKDDEEWEKVRYSSNVVFLNSWIENNSNNRNIPAAKDLVKRIIADEEENRKKKRKILNDIYRNPNTYTPNEIREFLNNGVLFEQELLDIDIPQSAIDNLENVHAPELQLGVTPSCIPEGYTEVYFWGGTGSGKTCALGAILHMAEKEGYLNIATGDGYLYANQVKNIFSDDNIANDFLPAPSPVEATQYLPFTLKKPNEKRSRSVSLIELSGEIFKCFFHKISTGEFPSASHENTFNSLDTFLKSKNRKIHFFFIDYARENISDNTGIKQSDYLAAASTYFDDNKVFAKTADAIYLVLTKSDLLRDENDNFIPQENRADYAEKYLEENNYKAFKNTMKSICEKHSINGGFLTVQPFSLGKVYFKEICDFEGSSASELLQILLNRIPKTRKSILLNK